MFVIYIKKIMLLQQFVNYLIDFTNILVNKKGYLQVFTDLASSQPESMEVSGYVL